MDRSIFTPHVACVQPGGFRFDELRACGVPILEIPMRSFLSRDFLSAANQFRQYLHRHKIRLVHAFDFTANVFAPLLARCFRTPVVLSSQRCYWELVPRRYRVPIQIAHRLADGVLVNCEALRRHVIAECSLPARKIHVCYNGLDTAVFRHLPRSRPPALRQASVVVGVICVLRPEKDLPTLLEAFARLRQWHPAAHLVVVGSGPEAPGLERRSVDLGIRDACLFQPATSEVAAWLQAIDIFVLPSTSEALSNSLMEAMACGCCAVASRVGGNPELVSHRRTGLLFEAGNPADLADQLRSAVENATLRQDLAQAGAAYMAENFSLSTTTNRLQVLYEAFLTGHAVD